MTIDAFIKSLASYEGALTFNPWKDTDLRYEVENAPSIRKEQLHDYLSRRVGKAKLFLIAEACGYQGGHFTGIAMTCERMILNEHPAVNSLMILGKEGKRTSRKDSPMIAKPTQKEKGFNEPTDSVVWKACLDAGLSADEFILWNIYPSILIRKTTFFPTGRRQMMNLPSGSPTQKSSFPSPGPFPFLPLERRARTRSWMQASPSRDYATRQMAAPTFSGTSLPISSGNKKNLPPIAERGFSFPDHYQWCRMKRLVK